ncbi:MAG: SPOR domain-containing protein [Treponema sp.]|jgi:DedD protein|nr:SPOR domain-containing protein [Treponema sp.]
MEKKKLLLVAVSVGVFLAIVISAAILIFTPRSPESGTALSAARPIPAGALGITPGQEPLQTQPATVDAADMIRNAGEIQGIQAPPQTAVQENQFYINRENAEDDLVAENPAEGAARVVINVPKPSAAAVPDTPAETAGRSAPRQAVPANRPAPAKPAAAPAKPAAPPAAAPEKTYNDYWVQTGAFTAKVRAEGVKETLSSKGITSIIENREVDGKVWYRVRVGPYTSENEANYWLALVKSIDGFGDSQVRMTQARR